MKDILRNILFLLLALLAILGFFSRNHHFKGQLFNSSQVSEDNSDAALLHAFENRLSDKQLGGKGVVIKLLPDDNKGRRHQKFILQLVTGQTLLVAHNIDLAPRIKSLQKGDVVHFYGEYEWNEKGGIIHWTHHDPKGGHPGGWLKHQGKIYQ